MDALPLEFNLQARALKLRRRLLDLHFQSQSGHIASSLSCLDILIHIFARRLLRPEDRIMVSKGHAASAVYVTMVEHEQMKESELKSFGYLNNQNSLGLPSHLSWSLPAPSLAGSGSLGHGLGIAAGWALGQRIQNTLGSRLPRVCCVLSDGELNAGSVWEALMFVHTHKLTNIEIYVDLNGLQGCGPTKEILDLEPLGAKLESFGFDVRHCDGHNLSESNWGPAPEILQNPCVFLCKTLKGRGSSFMENNVTWHYKTLTASEHTRALAELAAAESALGRGP